MSITRFASILRQHHPSVMHIPRTHARFMATSTTLQSPSEHRVILDDQTLYVDQSLAEALGWKPEQRSDAGIELSLSGWGPTYFTIAPTGSESGESQCILSRAFCSHFAVTKIALLARWWRVVKMQMSYEF
jgi:hypothetical protein